MSDIMPVKLVSDFDDFYDCHFDYSGNAKLSFIRIGKDRAKIKKMFSILKSCDVQIPMYGKVSNIKINKNNEGKAIICCDEYGDNKTKVTLEEACDKYPGCYYMKYIAGDDTKIWRYIQIGERSFLILFHTDMPWYECKQDDYFKFGSDMLGEVFANGLIDGKYPFAQFGALTILSTQANVLFAVDFVSDLCGNLYVINYNNAPKISNITLCDELSDIDIANLIIQKINDRYIVEQRCNNVQRLVESVFVDQNKSF